MLAGLMSLMNDANAAWAASQRVGDLRSARVEVSREIQGAAGNFIASESFRPGIPPARKAFSGLLTDVINGTDVRMIQSGSGLGLPPKPFQGLAVLRQVFGQEFEGDEAVEAGILGLVNHTHTSAAEFFQDAVV